MLKKIFPSVDWLKQYNSGFFKNDLIAGITLAAYAIPVSLAYASLAGLPGQYGIYGYLIGGVCYALLGTSRQIAIGPSSAISLVIGTTIAELANGDTQRWVEIASLTGLVFAGLALIAYFLRLSGIINFISETVLIGFKAGAALTIGLSQLPKLLGLKGGGHYFYESFIIIFQQIPDTKLVVFFFGLAAIIVLILGEKLLPGRPIAILVVAVSIFLIYKTNLGDYGFNTIGYIPSGLPQFHLPTLRVRDVDGVMPLAFACFLLSYIESISTARTLAQKHEYEIDVRQELLALGITNAAVALGQGYPVAGGLSQSAVNDTAGAKTPISLIISSGTIAICLLYLTHLLEHLPTVILASIVLVSIKGLFDIRELKHLFHVNKKEFFIAIIALIGVLLFGILKGVVLATVTTLILVIKAASNPNVAFLGKIPGTHRYTDIARHPDNENIPGVLIIRIESSIFYFNIDYINLHIWPKIDNSVKTVILDMSSSPTVDIAGARFLKQLFLDLKAKGIIFKIAEADSKVRDTLRAENLEVLLGRISRFVSVDDLVEEAIQTQKKIK